VIKTIPTKKKCEKAKQLSQEDFQIAEKRREAKGKGEKERGDLKNASLKLNIQKTKTMASGPITLWQIDGETMETVRDFIFYFLGSKITADGDCSRD